MKNLEQNKWFNLDQTVHCSTINIPVKFVNPKNFAVKFFLDRLFSLDLKVIIMILIIYIYIKNNEEKH